jgi:uncharacterized protein
MTREEVISTLKNHEPEIRRFKATGLYLFGSAARDELGPDSDIDLYLDYEPDRSFSFVELLDLQEFLTLSLRRKVDLMTRSSLHPALRAGIEKSSLRII